MGSDLVEHVGTKYVGDEGTSNNQRRNSHRVMLSVSCLRSRCSKHLMGRYGKGRAKNGRGARPPAYVNGNGNLMRLWSINRPLQKMMNGRAVLSAGYHVQQYDDAS